MAAQVYMPGFPQRSAEDDPANKITKAFQLLAANKQQEEDTAMKRRAFDLQEKTSTSALANQKRDQQIQDALIGDKGLQKVTNPTDGSTSYLKIPGYKSLGDQKTEAEIGKLKFEASGKGKDPNGLDGLIKALTVQKDMQAVEKGKREATEVPGPKAQAANFGRRMESADQIMNDLYSKGYDRTNVVDASLASITPDSMLPGNRVQQDQGERNFLNAILRRESGAAISNSEMDSGSKQYFDRPGDDAATKQNKAANRAQAIAGLKAEAGPDAWEKVTPAAQNILIPQKAPLNNAKSTPTPEEALAELTRRQSKNASASRKSSNGG